MYLPNILLILVARLGLASAYPPEKRATARTSPSDGCIVVRKLGPQSGEHGTVGAALLALGKTSTTAACIFIYPGLYKEQLVVGHRGPLTIYGYTTA